MNGVNHVDKASPNDNGTTFHAFATRQQASLALADQLTADLSHALAHSPGANLVVSGGTSPIDLFHNLRTRDLDWNKLTVIPSDERVVAADHPDRNDAMIRRELLQDKASEARLLSLVRKHTGATAGIEMCLESIPSHFDAAILGMGEDGHTASLFPDSPGIAEALMSKAQLLRMSVPRLKMERVSLSPAALLTSKRIDLLFFGQNKRTVFEAAIKQGPATTYPIRVVLHQDQVPVRVFWAP